MCVRVLTLCTLSQLYNVTADDTLYCSLPLYHSAGGNIGIGLSWYTGAPLVLRSKFSVSRFWVDCVKAPLLLVILPLGRLSLIFGSRHISE